MVIDLTLSAYYILPSMYTRLKYYVIILLNFLDILFLKFKKLMKLPKWINLIIYIMIQLVKQRVRLLQFTQ